MRVAFQTLDARRTLTLFERYFSSEYPARLAPPVDQTPGDFAVVAARAGLLGISDPNILAKWLREEAEARDAVIRPIGF